MARWEPGASDRLRASAVELFEVQGFDATTTAEIAERAGVTERTFFRHFADKREVLFAGQDRFQAAFLDGVVAAPAGPPLGVVAAALDTVAATYFSDERREGSRRRGAVIAAHPALQERELLKLAALAVAVAAALRERGAGEPTATLAAESMVTVFRISFDRWITSDDVDVSLADVQREVLAELTALTGPGN